MKHIAISNKKKVPDVTALIILVCAILTVIGLYLSASLLTWVVHSKFDNIENLSPTEVTTQLRERQLGCLAKNIYYEAGNEPFEGKVAVAQVTMNRVRSGIFPDDLCKVIYQKNIFYEKIVCQFSWYCDRAATVKPINAASYDESMIVAKKVLLEKFELPSLKPALYYHATYIDPKWNRKKITTIGHHIFYE